MNIKAEIQGTTIAALLGTVVSYPTGGRWAAQTSALYYLQNRVVPNIHSPAILNGCSPKVREIVTKILQFSVPVLLSTATTLWFSSLTLSKGVILTATTVLTLLVNEKLFLKKEIPKKVEEITKKGEEKKLLEIPNPLYPLNNHVSKHPVRKKETEKRLEKYLSQHPIDKPPVEICRILYQMSKGEDYIPESETMESDDQKKSMIKMMLFGPQNFSLLKVDDIQLMINYCKNSDRALEDVRSLFKRKYNDNPLEVKEWILDCLFYSERFVREKGVGTTKRFEKGITPHLLPMAMKFIKMDHHDRFMLSDKILRAVVELIDIFQQTKKPQTLQEKAWWLSLQFDITLIQAQHKMGVMLFFFQDVSPFLFEYSKNGLEGEAFFNGYEQKNLKAKIFFQKCIKFNFVSDTTFTMSPEVEKDVEKCQAVYEKIQILMKSAVEKS